MISSVSRIAYCASTTCKFRKPIDVRGLLTRTLEELGYAERIGLVETECLISCHQGPSIMFLPGGKVFQVRTEENFTETLQGFFAALQHPTSPLLSEPRTKKEIPGIESVDFFAKQRLIVLRNRGHIDGESIEEYIAHDGYLGLYKALTSLTPEEVIGEVKTSGLRGRGGAGFPTGRKWEEARRYRAYPKYVICNGDEGDPGAFMDRSVMESDPHAVLEGMIICGYATGATQGYIYVRAEYPLALRMLRTAIARAREKGFLGRNILGSGFDFDVHIYPGAGAFVCGESSALMVSVEGKRGMPRTKPPRSTEAGLWGRPTCLNNVETFANIPQIILHGGNWFRAIGTEDSTGTKVFSLTGAVKNVGLVETPMGTDLRTIIFEIGGGIRGNARFKAVQLGGPAGGCLTEDHLHLPVTFDSLQEVGAIMGSGGIVVMDDSNCMVDVARFFTQFCVDESCGKCVPCRVGLRVMLGLLEKIILGRGEPEDLGELERQARHIQTTSHCGLGQAAPNPVLSTLRYFRDEYEAHIHEKRCPARVCVDLLRFEIDPDKCRKCGLCVKVCPVGAMTWQKGEYPVIHRDLCIRCKSCIRACKFKAIN
ncbi:MAG: NADH-quinone oxidoreductase subunit NuoF [Pseudomonadota bacterium]|nr:NADH-quinone oxidoreductase subunit NuoF [Pseudomonadota bacterium]